MERLRKYATTATVSIPLLKFNEGGFAIDTDYTYAAGDIKVSIDEGAAADITTAPTAISMGNTKYWKFVFSAAEMTGKRIVCTIADSAVGQAIEDSMFAIQTYGHTSAGLVSDFSTTWPASTDLTAISTQVSAVATNVTSLTTRVPTALDGAGFMKAGIEAIQGSTASATALSAVLKQYISGGTLQTGDVNSLVLASGDGKSWWPGHVYIQVTNGVGDKQSRIIDSITGATGTHPVVVPVTPFDIDMDQASYVTFVLVEAESVWAEPLPGAFNSGSAGYILGNYVTGDIYAALTAVALNVTTLINRVGPFLASASDTIYGWMKAMVNKTVSAPADLISGGSAYSPATQSIEAQGEVAVKVNKSAKVILEGTAVAGTLAVGSITTNLTFTNVDQVKDRLIIFSTGPNTYVPRTILSSTTGGVITFAAMPATPVAGNIFAIV